MLEQYNYGDDDDDDDDDEDDDDDDDLQKMELLGIINLPRYSVKKSQGHDRIYKE